MWKFCFGTALDYGPAAIGLRGGIRVRLSLAKAHRQQAAIERMRSNGPFTDEPLPIGRTFPSFPRRPVFSATAA
jgi:hypothetical protein